MVTGEAVGPWRAELTDLVRGACGGLLFGVPLLYTMEVWWTGSHTEPHQMLLVLVLLAVPAFALNKTAGFRADPDVRTSDALADTVEAVALGIVVSAAVLALLGEIGLSMSMSVVLGKVLYEAIAVCLGIGVARHFLSGDRAGGGPLEDAGGAGGQDDDDGIASSALADLGAATGGAVFVALNIAPTDEVPMIASVLGPVALLALIGASLLASYAIVFSAGFTNQDSRHAQDGMFQRPAAETLVAYLVSLVVAAVLLLVFQRGPDGAEDFLERTLVLGFPASIGGAAGRLVV